MQLKLLEETSILPLVPASRWDCLALSAVETASDPTSGSHRSQILSQEFLLWVTLEKVQLYPAFSVPLKTPRMGNCFQSLSLLTGLTSAQAVSLF